MFQFTEDLVKAWLAADGIAVPQGRLSRTPEGVAAAARDLGGAVVVKAAVAAGRRGKDGGIRKAADPSHAAKSAAALLGQTIAGRSVDKLYVEAAIDIARELYLSFAFHGATQKVVLSRLGGVDIEEIRRTAPDAVIIETIDPLECLPPWRACALWERAGIDSPLLPALSDLTTKLYGVFRTRDALLLELNPIAVSGGRPIVVGAMMEGDGNASFRHPEWGDPEDVATIGGRPLNEREKRVVTANRNLPGGAVRYNELDGDIALLVGGGGAGLLQHDMIIRAGGFPANHTDTSPGRITEKLKVILESIFTNPRTRALLLSYNRQQMSRCDLKIEALVDVLRRLAIDPAAMPIVIRLTGSYEEEARALARAVDGLHYLPSEATLDEAVALVVELARSRSAERMVS